MHIEEMMPGVWRVSASTDWPKPHFGICGSMHGDEPCGANAIGRMARAFENGELQAPKGTVFLIHANLEATSKGRRCTADGDDLNQAIEDL